MPAREQLLFIKAVMKNFSMVTDHTSRACLNCIYRASVKRSN